jgi:hypothetical protein
MAIAPRLRFGLLLAAVLFAAAPAWAAGLSEAQVRAFFAQQQRAWNAGDLAAYFTAFQPDAVFTDQYRTPAGQVVPYGSSTLAQARVHTRKFRSTFKVSETGEIVRITLGADGRTAQVDSRVTSRTEDANGLRVTCAERRQELVLGAGQLRSKGQTDTFTRCPR